MPQASKIDGNTLSWVKSEIDQTMDQARQSLEAYVETPEDESQLRFCLNYLHQVYGTLQMVELYGAALLSEELERLSQALIDKRVSKREEAYEVMMRGMMQLPDYLEKLQAGQMDYPIILLPILNDLRAVRNAPLLSEGMLFSPNLSVEAPIPIGSTDESIDGMAKKLRHVYHLGLLDWYKGANVETGLKKIGAVIEKLRPAANDPDTSRMLWAASGVVEALRDKGIEGSVAVKLLLGQLDRQIKKIIDRGEFALASEPPVDLLKNLLYYVASSNSAGSLVAELKNAFQLAEVMPDAETLERARADLTAPNAELLRTVSNVLMEDLTQVKDNLDVFVRSEQRDASVLTGLCEQLNKMSDTLGMLGFGDQRIIVQHQIALLSEMANGNASIDENVLMDVAGALLSIESRLAEPTIVNTEEIEMATEASSDESLVRRFNEPEQRKLVKRVVDEVKVDLANIKDAFNDFSRSPKNVEILKPTPGLLDRIRGSLSILALTRASEILNTAAQYIATRILNSSERPEPRTLDLLADTISSVEYYLESLTESWGHPTAILEVAEQSLEQLDGSAVVATTAANEAESELALADDDETMVDLVAPELAQQAEAESEEPTMEIQIEPAEPEFKLEGLELEEQDAKAAEMPEHELTLDLQGFDSASEIELEEDALPETVEHAELPEVEEPSSESIEASIAAEENSSVTMQAPPVSAPSLADELDDEIIEIFLEEAEEEHANISRLLPRWYNNPEDSESLKDLRRSFHTLKGSGRLVGAADVGEFAWAFENMLNRVIDHTIETSPEIYELVDRARQTLPTLFELFKANEKPGQQIFGLMQQAEAASQGKAINLDSTTTSEPVSDDTHADPVGEAEPGLPTAEAEQANGLTLELEEQDDAPSLQIAESDDAQTSVGPNSMELSLDDSEPMPVLETDETVDGFDLAVELPEDSGDESTQIDLTSMEEEIDAAEFESLAESAATNEVSEGTANRMDPVLFDIYQKEIETHLQALHEYIVEWRDKIDRSSNHKLVRALHTLKGSSRTASVPQIAELCNLLEEQAKYLQDHEGIVDHEFIELLVDSGDFIGRTVSMLAIDPDNLPDNSELLMRANALLDKTRSESPTMQMIMPEDFTAAVADDASEQEVELTLTDEVAEIEVESGIPEPEPLVQVEPEPVIAEQITVDTAEPAEEVIPDYDMELLEIFIEEGVEILDESDRTLNEWIADPSSPEHVKSLQRQLHTLKGGARMAGVMEIGDLSHSIETMLTNVVDNRLDISQDMFDVLQKAQDSLVHMLDVVRDGQAPADAAALIARMDAITNGDENVEAESTAEVEPLIQSQQADDMEVMDEEPIIELSEELDDIDSANDAADADSVFSIADEIEIDEAVLPEAQTLTADDDQDEPDFDATEEINLSDADFDFSANDDFDMQAPFTDEGDETDNAAAEQDADEVSLPPVNATEKAPSVSHEDNIIPLDVNQQSEPDPLPTPAAGQTLAEPEPEKKLPPTAREFIRVRSELLDNLVNFAGEVSIYRSRMEQQTNAFRYNLTELDDTVARLRDQLRKFEMEAEAQIQYRIEETGIHHEFDPLEFDRFTQMQTLSRGMLESLNDLDSLRGILSNLTRESETLLLQQSRVNTELQEGLMRTRMVPISGQAPRLRRIVRQTADELGKKVELNIEGGENELDRTVLERVMSPIEHMLRNAIAHGIEKPEERSAAGKPATGRINLSFNREGSDIVITVTDDGAGINLNAIREKAIERGILKPGAQISEEALIDIILESGFSTAAEVTQIAGRGVGMDVVNNEIKQLGGLLNINTEKGKGSAFSISMPLSLSVTRALMVHVAEETYAIPLIGIETVERVTRDEIGKLQAEKNSMYSWLGNDYQYIHLGNAMGISEMQMPSEEHHHVPLLLVRSGEYRAAIHVDTLIGSREIVVKPVGPQLSTLRGIAGATVMGDGRVVLILDLGVLMRLASTEHEEAFVESSDSATGIPQAVVEEKRQPLVMVVDDSITVRKVTTRLLERNNFKTVSAKDGVDALAQLQEYSPDVMLLDVEMPRMDGFELATNIRNDNQLKSLPIIMITSRTGQKHRDRAMNIGVNIYMGKPYSEGELLDNIDKLLHDQG